MPEDLVLISCDIATVGGCNCCRFGCSYHIINLVRNTVTVSPSFCAPSGAGIGNSVGTSMSLIVSTLSSAGLMSSSYILYECPTSDKYSLA